MKRPCANVSFAVAVVLAFAGLAAGSDLESGPDSLPVLSNDATLIVAVATATEVPSPTRLAKLFRLQTSAVIRGHAKGNQILALLPLMFGPATPDQMKGSFAFLLGPLKREEREKWKLAGYQPVYVFVNGKAGIVPIASDARRKAIVDYLTMGSSKATPAAYQWSVRYLQSGDAYLQYSAIRQLRRFGPRADALTSLHDAVIGNKLTQQNQTAAIKVIAAAGTKLSTSLLKQIAENTSLPSAVRTTSVFSIGYLPGGLEQLQKWKTGPDQTLQIDAAKALERQQLLPP